jgi:hypothetical protein
MAAPNVVGCVGHGAMRLSKRTARHTGKPWLTVRQASIASLAGALAPLFREKAEVRDC